MNKDMMEIQGPEILLVDNDEGVRKFMVRLLTFLDCRVQSVSSGKEAVKMIQQEKFDLVITDLEMPEIDGRDLAKTVKIWQPQCPVILLTGCELSLCPETEKFNGIDVIIHKPATLNTLRREILNLLH